MDKESTPKTVYLAVVNAEAQLKRYKAEYNCSNGKVAASTYHQLVEAFKAVLSEVPVTATISN